MGVDILNRQVTLTGCVPSETANAINRSSSVKKSLFGPVDHQEAMSFFEKEFSKMDSENKKRWNFDFVNEKPIKGAFKWEKVVPSNTPQNIVSKTTFKVTKSKSPRKCPLRTVKRKRQTNITEYVSVTKKIETRQK